MSMKEISLRNCFVSHVPRGLPPDAICHHGLLGKNKGSGSLHLSNLHMGKLRLRDASIPKASLQDSLSDLGNLVLSHRGLQGW